MIGFVFPSDYLNNKKADDFYHEEYLAFKEAGYPVYLVNIDDLSDSKIYPKLKNEQLIYRGWMLSKETYEELNQKLNNQLLVSTKDYLKSHHLPNWYENIKEYTIPSFITTQDDAIKTFQNLPWKTAFIKDYVKSIKTGKGSVVDSVDDIQRAFDDILKYKGFIEQGIVFRQVLDLKPETETRYFVLNGQIFSDSENEEMFNLVSFVAKNHDALFFSVDVIKDVNDKLFVIEIGDGQVSDTVGWNLNNFVKIFKSFENNKKFKI